VLLAAVNPKNLMLSLAAGAGLAALGLSTGDALGSLLVYIIVGSLTIAVPVVYYLAGGDAAKARLTEMKTCSHTQRGGHSCRVPHPRRRPHRQGPPTADVVPAGGRAAVAFHDREERAGLGQTTVAHRAERS